MTVAHASAEKRPPTIAAPNAGISAGDQVISSGGYALPDKTQIKIEATPSADKDAGDKSGKDPKADKDDGEKPAKKGKE